MKEPVLVVLGMAEDFLSVGCPIQDSLLAWGAGFRCNGSAMRESAKDPPKLRLNGAPKVLGVRKDAGPPTSLRDDLLCFSADRFFNRPVLS